MIRKPQPAPLMIAVGGMSGSGKTLLAEQLAAKMPGSVLLDSDAVKKAMMGIPPEQSLPDSYYTPENIKLFIKHIHGEAEKHLKTGKTVIVTGLFLDNDSRRGQQRLADKCGAGFIGLYLDAPLGVLFSRVTRRENTVSDADLEVTRRQVRKSVHGQRGLHWHIVDATGTPEEVTRGASRLVLFELHRQDMRAGAPVPPPLKKPRR